MSNLRCVIFYININATRLSIYYVFMLIFTHFKWSKPGLKQNLEPSFSPINQDFLESCQTEGVDGLDVRLIHQQQLPLEMAVARVVRHTAAQLLGNALPQLGSGGTGVGDDKKVIQVRLLLPQHAQEQPLHLVILS